MNQLDLADDPLANENASFLAQRIVAEVVGYRAHQSRFFQKRNQSGGFARIERQRFFAQNVFTGAEQLTGGLKVKMVWSAEMNDLHRGVGGKFIERIVRTRQMK